MFGTLFEVIAWVAFGMILGGFVAFARRRKRFDAELILIGGGAALLGGIIASVLPATTDWVSGPFDITSFLFALVVAALALYVDWRLRIRPGSRPR